MLGNSHTVVDKIDIVAEQSISRVLRDDTERNEKHQAISVTSGLQEVGVIARLPVLKLESEGLLDFTELELDGRILSVAISMVMSERRKRLFVSFLRNVPSWRFWNP